MRDELPILRGDDLRAYMDDVRERTLDVLDDMDLAADAADPLLRDGFVYELILAHEHQHNETMLQLLQMVDGYEPRRVDSRPPTSPSPTAQRWSASTAAPMRSAPGTTGFAYDNERPRHTVELAPFEIDRPRSPTPPSPHSWRRPAPSRRCTGSATATAG